MFTFNNKFNVKEKLQACLKLLNKQYAAKIQIFTK